MEKTRDRLGDELETVQSMAHLIQRCHPVCTRKTATEITTTPPVYSRYAGQPALASTSN